MHSIHYEILPVIQILPYNFQHDSPSVPWLTYELSPLFYTWTSWTYCLLCWLHIWSWQVDSRLSRKSRRMDSERDRAHNKNKCVLSALSDHTQSRLLCALTHAPGPCPKVKNPLPNSHRMRGESNTLCSNVSFQLFLSTSPIICAKLWTWEQIGTKSSLEGLLASVFHRTDS